MNSVKLVRAAMMAVEDYNPAVIIAAVNELQPLGKQPALDEIQRFAESRRDKAEYPYGLFWVLRTLFEVPTEFGFPPVVMGTPDIPPPTDPRKLPRFPIVILGDIPFLVVRGYVLMGLPEPVEVHVAYFRDYGSVRERPLMPASPVGGIEPEFLKLWQAAYGDAHAAHALETIKAQWTRFTA